MSNIRTVNLIWERRYRGVSALSRYALDDSGTLTVALPRPLEARAYDLARLQLDGSVAFRVGFSVETLLQLELSSVSEDFLGRTSDDIYLFHNGAKGRFLAERHITYVDAALSADGAFLAVGFSDLSGVNFALALGDIAGQVVWLNEIDATLSAVAISRDGSRVAFGAEHGQIWLLDSGRRTVWEFGQEWPIRILACSTDGLRTAYGTSAGTVGLIDGSGKRLWDVRVPGEPLALTLSGDGERCAILCRPTEENGTTKIYCVGTTGQFEWEYEAERRLLGISLSENGRYLATSGRDGTLTLYEIVLGETSAAVSDAESLLQQIEERRQAEDLSGALNLLRSSLDLHPDDEALYIALLARRREIFASGLQRAAVLRAEENPAGAIRILAALLGEEPLETEVATALREVRILRSGQLRAEAQARREQGDLTGAETLLREAVGVSPLDVPEARRELAALRAQHAAEADAEAERLLAQGALEAGIAALERAQTVDPSAERLQTMRRAQTAMEFAAGMAAYNEKRYTEAVFQFKQVLAREPGHSDAKRYLNFAQKFAQDATTDSLADRFSRLE